MPVDQGPKRLDRADPVPPHLIIVRISVKQHNVDGVGCGRVEHDRRHTAQSGCGTSACTRLTGPKGVSIVTANGMRANPARQRRYCERGTRGSPSDRCTDDGRRCGSNQYKSGRSGLPMTTAVKRFSSYMRASSEYV